MADIIDKSKIQELRQKQGNQEFQTAEAIRAHIQMILRDRVDRYIDNQTQKEVTRSDLTPQDLSSMAHAMEAIQRVQRLSLGMPTNIPAAPRQKVSAKEIPQLEVPGADKVLNPKE